MQTQGPVTAFYGLDAVEIDAIRHDIPNLHVDPNPLPQCSRYQVGVARIGTSYDASELHRTGLQVASQSQYCLVLLLEKAVADSVARTVRQQHGGTTLPSDLESPDAVELLQALEYHAVGRVAYVRRVVDCPFWISYFGASVRGGTAPTPEDRSYIKDTAGLRAIFGDVLNGRPAS